MLRPALVLKFGGSSVATKEKMDHVAARVARFRRDGYHVAVVVSARGDTTDELLALAREMGGDALDGRELDQLLATGECQSVALLALALGRQGVLARSLTGPQWGLKAQGRPGMGVLTGCDPKAVQDAFTEGAVVVAAGFQALDPKGDVVTLGRGGSDLSAIALAGALEAQACTIFTDVSGLFSADPRSVPGAKKIEALSPELALEMTVGGAKVLQSRCVELAASLGVPLYLAHSMTEEQGSWVMKEVCEGAAVVAVVDQSGWTKAKVGCSAEGLSKFLSAATNEGVAPIEFSHCERGYELWFLAAAQQRLKEVASRWNVALTVADEVYTKLTIVGSGLGNHGELCSALPELLLAQGLIPLRLAVGGNSFALWVSEEQGKAALELLHRKLVEEEFSLAPCPTPSL